MSKDKKSATHGILKTFFDPKAWASYEQMREIWLYLVHGFSRAFTPKMPKTYQNLDDVKKKYSLTAEDVQKKQSAFLKLAWFMVFLAVLIFAYTMYQLLYAHYLAVLIGLVVTLLALGFAFRYHFWYFQLKQQKLGCTLGEWFKFGLLGAKE